MVRFSVNIASAFVLLILLCVIPIESTKFKSRLRLLGRECQNAVDALREITICSPANVAQLSNMGNAFIGALNMATGALNSVIPNIPPCEDRTVLAETTQLLSNFINDMQYVLLDNADELKEKVRETLEEIGKFAENFKGQDLQKNSNDFVNNQMRNLLDFLSLAAFKLKYQAKFFKTPNHGLQEVLKKNEASLVEALACVSSSDKEAREELSHLLQLKAIFTVTAISRLQTWIQVNPDNPDGIKRAQYIVDTGNKLYNQGNDAGQERCVSKMKAALLDIYATAVKVSIGISCFQYPDNSGGLEYIRGSIFDVVATGAAFAEIIKSVLL